jgi:hypothetical protein
MVVNDSGKIVDRTGPGIWWVDIGWQEASDGDIWAIDTCGV